MPKRKQTRKLAPVRVQPVVRRLVGLPKDARTLVHFRPHAYCVAKPASHCAVFVCAPQENTLARMEYGPSELIQNASVADVHVGDWRSLAYCVFGESGSWTVAVPYQPDVAKAPNDPSSATAP